jgi:hypothetical protein
VSGSTASSPGGAVVVVAVVVVVDSTAVVEDDSAVVDDEEDVEVDVEEEACADAAPAAVSADAVNRAASSRARIGAAYAGAPGRWRFDHHRDSLGR